MEKELTKEKMQKRIEELEAELKEKKDENKKLRYKIEAMQEQEIMMAQRFRGR